MVNKNKKMGLAVWALGLVLANALLFCLSRELTMTVWITFGFVWLAFLSAIALQLLVWKRNADLDEQILHIPALIISYIYMIVQIPICVIFALGAVVIPWKVTLLVQIILLVLAWFAAIGSLAGNDHIKRVNGRGKDHHFRS